MPPVLRFFSSSRRRLRLREASRRCARDSSGNFTILFAFAAPVMILFVGMAIDYWVGLFDKSRVDTAADAAAIAAVNGAKAFFAANSGPMSGTALSNAAKAAGIVLGDKVFAADMGSTLLVQSVTPAITMDYSDLTFTSSVHWSGQV